MARKLATHQAVLAFIDILGAKDTMQKNTDRSLNAVHKVYEKSLKIYERLFADKVNFDISIFSDNIVVALRVSDDSRLKLAFKAVQTMAAIIQGNFLFSNILVRGGISYGSFFKDEIMIWGRALVDAYSIENTVSIYPRIVVDPELVGKLGVYSEKEIDSTYYWLKRDNDGMLYIDYLQPNVIKNYDLLLMQEVARQENRVLSNIDNPRVMQKVIWHSNYIHSKLGDSENAEKEKQRN